MAGANGKGKAVAMQADKATGGVLPRKKKLSPVASSSSSKKNSVGTSTKSGGEVRKRGRPSKNIPRARFNAMVLRSPTFPGYPLLVQRPLIPLPRGYEKSINFRSEKGDLVRKLLREIDPMAIRYLFKKELKNSDVSQARRIVIPKKCAETYLPRLYAKEGFFMNMDDMDGMRVWCFRFRYWPNNHSRMYILEYTGEFVEAHGLNFGDYIFVYKDDRNERFVIEAQKGFPPQTTTMSNLAAEPEEVDKACYCFENFPIMDEMGTHFLDDSILTTFGDFPTTVSGGSLPEMPSFESLNFCLDDFP